MDKKSIGNIGEDLACEYLVSKGYKILTRNYRKPWGEIDIIGKHKDKTLVFFEIKTFEAIPQSGLRPEDNMSEAKLKKLRRVCQTFALGNPELVNERRGWQIDLLAIVLDGNTEVAHYENV